MRLRPHSVTLRLGGCELGFYDPRLADAREGARFLDLRNQHFQCVPSIIRVFTQLEYIILTGNDIKHIRAGDFQGLDNLLALELQGTFDGRWVPDGPGPDAEQYHDYQLCFNHMVERVDPGAFDALRELKSLVMTLPPDVKFDHAALQPVGGILSCHQLDALLRNNG